MIRKTPHRKFHRAINENCFVSVRSIAETLQLSHSTAFKHLHEELGFQSFLLRWVPHLSAPGLKESRCAYAIDMIPVLLSTQKDDWRHRFTGDESWSSCHIRHVGCGHSRGMTLHLNHDGRFGRRNSCLQLCGIVSDST
jgi:hypothetical protein